MAAKHHTTTAEIYETNIIDLEKVTAAYGGKKYLICWVSFYFFLLYYVHLYISFTFSCSLF